MKKLKKIGPSFSEEIFEAGLGGLPFSWGEDGMIEGVDKLTPEQLQKLEQVINNHDHKKVPTHAG